MMQEFSTSTPSDEFFFGSLPLGYVAIRKDGVIAQANEAVARALSYERGDLVGRLAVEFPFDDPNRRVFLEQMAQRSQGITGAYALFLRGRGSERLKVGCFAVPHFDGSGTFWGSRGIIVPFDQLHQLALQNGETSEDVLRRTLGGQFLHANVDSRPPGLHPPTNGDLALHASPMGTFHPNDNPVMAALLPKLTKRERDVVALLLMGLRVNGVADRLELSHYTVRNHLKRIFRKAGVNSQGQLLLKLNSLP